MAVLKNRQLNVWPEWYNPISKMLEIAIPTIFNFFFMVLNEQTNVIFLGHYGDTDSQAAAGIGTMMQNVCGMSIGFGLLGALDTLVSQANGAGQHHLCASYLQRGRVLAALQMLWILPLMYCSEPILLFLGQKAEVARHAAAYNRRAGLGMFSFLQFQAGSKFLTNRKCASPPTIIVIVSSILHVAWVSLFVGHWRMGNAGIGYCNAISWTTQLFLVHVYLARNAASMGFEPSEVCWIQAKRAFRGWGEYMQVAVPSTVQMCSEWWFWDISTFSMGYLGAATLAAHTDTVMITAILTMPAVGLQVASATLVGNALGQNNPHEARRLIILIAMFNVAICCVFIAALLGYKAKIAAFYTDQEEVAKIIRVLLGIVAVQMFVNTTQNVMSGMLRGMGKMRICSMGYFGVYWLFVFPLGLVLVYTAHVGIAGMWVSMAIGQTCLMLVFGITIRNTRLDSLAQSISSEMRQRGQEDQAGARNLEELKAKSYGSFQELKA